MSRIDAPLATQIGDQLRPVQVASEQHLQVAAARLQQLNGKGTSSEQVLKNDTPPTIHDVRAAVAEVKQVLELASGKQLNFEVDDSGKQVLVKIMSSEGDLLRQIPSREMLELHKRLSSIVGVLVDKKA